MKRTYRCNPETLQMEETTSSETWRNGGDRYSPEQLQHIRQNNLVPMETFKDKWAAAEKERERIHRLGNGDLSQLKGNSDPKVMERKREMYQRMQHHRRRG